MQDEDIAETSSSRTEHLSNLSQKGEDTLWNKSAVSQSNENQDAAKERTMFRTSEDTCSLETDAFKTHMNRTKDGVLQSSSSLSAGDLQTLDFSSAHSQQFLKLGAPLLFHPGQLSVKPEAFSTTGMGHLFSSSPGVNNPENGAISSQSITSPSPFMFHFSQHVLASQVDFSRSTAC